jgi:hypothetical protein
VSASLGGSAAERAKSAQNVQAAADVVTFAVAGAASVASGAALAAVGWNDMQIAGWACAGLMLCAVGASPVAATDGAIEAPSTVKGLVTRGDDTQA